MRTIWKFLIAIGPITTIEVPGTAVVRLAAIDPETGGPAIWVELETDQFRTKRRFAIHRTGGEIDTDGAFPDYVGSMVDRSFVWHIFELRP